MQHLLAINELKITQIQQILQQAKQFLTPNDSIIDQTDLLAGTTLANLFFEPSTRTRSTFQLAAKRLSAEVLDLELGHSATKKGESLLDTIHNLTAMDCSLMVIRHALSGTAHFIAQHVAPHVHIINAGDGWHAHPTQALLDMLTIDKCKGNFTNLSVAIVGDIAYSRVARSQINALSILGTPDIRVVGPKTLLPANIENLGVHVYHQLEQGLQDVDVIIMLRVQRERMQACLLNESEYFKFYGLTAERLKLAKPDAIVLHPGPINHGMEINPEVANGPQSVVLKQVTFGIAIRMAVLTLLKGIQL